MTYKEYADRIEKERKRIEQAIKIINEANENLMILQNNLTLDLIKEMDNGV